MTDEQDAKWSAREKRREAAELRRALDEDERRQTPLVNRLRASGLVRGSDGVVSMILPDPADALEAADEIDRLTAQLAIATAASPAPVEERPESGATPVAEHAPESGRSTSDTQSPASPLVWTAEPAKGGGVDVTAQRFTIADDLDNGGWWLYVERVKVPTLADAQGLAQRLYEVLDPMGPSPARV